MNNKIFAYNRFRFLLATLLVGISSGLGGMLLALLLHFIQHIAYGYSPLHLISDESFLAGVSAASSMRRVVVLGGCGLLAGGGWWLLYQYGRPLVSIAKAVQLRKPTMPFMETLTHVLLQIITVALGSPLGREVAPREISALIACRITQWLKLPPKQSQTLVACAAGAGLAAVYNVPFGGAVFALEVLLNNFSWNAVLPALATASLAVVISWIGLGNETLYHIPYLSLSYSIAWWSVVTGPVFGIVAYWFAESMAQARATRKKQTIVWLCLCNFFFIGILAIYYPAILGNGKSPLQLAFIASLDLGFTFALFVLRFFVTWSSLRAGAEGGLLTPSLATGALLAVLLGIMWNQFWPNPVLGIYAVIGACAFLAASNKMPLTAIILIFEFTHLNFGLLIPILFAVVGALTSFQLCQHYKNKRIQLIVN